MLRKLMYFHISVYSCDNAALDDVIYKFLEQIINTIPISF